VVRDPERVVVPVAPEALVVVSVAVPVVVVVVSVAVPVARAEGPVALPVGRARPAAVGAVPVVGPVVSREGVGPVVRRRGDARSVVATRASSSRHRSG